MSSLPLHELPSQQALDERLAGLIAELLYEAIGRKGAASLGVSGGRTPVGLFEELSRKDIDWSKVTITLADERWVKTSSRDSNEKLVRETLLQGNAAAARFIGLKQGVDATRESLDQVEKQLIEAGAVPFDVLTLGLGEDGHTASLFPCSEEIYEAMKADNSQLLCKVSPKTAPYDRVTFTLPALLRSRKVYLLTLGANKLEVLEAARQGDNPMEMPIRAFLQAPGLDLEIYWAPK